MSAIDTLHCIPTNIGVFLSQIVHPHHISEVKPHRWIRYHIHTLLSDKYSNICGCCKTNIILHDALESSTTGLCLILSSGPLLDELSCDITVNTLVNMVTHVDCPLASIVYIFWSSGMLKPTSGVANELSVRFELVIVHTNYVKKSLLESYSVMESVTYSFTISQFL